MTDANIDANIRTELDDEGILLAVIDMPGRTMNVFSRALMDSLEQLIQRVESDPAVSAVVLTSGKSAFLAGADLDMIRVFTERALTDSADQLHELCGHLVRLFLRLEQCPKPWVAAVNGLALGGGLEVALACHARVVVDDPRVQLGLPEIKLGLLPGAGGTQRLPRLIGCSEGLRMLLTGDPVSPARAQELGIVNEVVPATQLIAAAKRHARAPAGIRAPWDRPGAEFSAAPFDFSRADVFEQITRAVGIGEELLARYPAYQAIMNCVVGGWNRPMAQAIRWEMDCFVQLIRDPVAGNMVRTLFLNRQKAAKLGPAGVIPASARVAVVGLDGAAALQLFEKRKAPVVAAAALTDNDIALLTPGATCVPGIGVDWLGAGDQGTWTGNAAAAIWLSPPGAHGQVAEILLRRDDAVARDAALLTSRWLGTTSLLTRGTEPLLPTLSAARQQAKELGCSEDETLLAVSLAAARVWSSGGIEDTELADVAAVIAGVHPPFTGGPFTYLQQKGAEAIRQQALPLAGRHAALFGIPPRLQELTASTPVA